MWDYSEKVMEYYRNPKNVGKIDDADAIGEAGSITCGDALKLYLKIKDTVVIDFTNLPFDWDTVYFFSGRIDSPKEIRTILKDSFNSYLCIK